MNPASRILLIDDEAIALANLTHVLQREGYAVVACKNGEDALAELTKSRFDLVLTDLKMPGLDGMDVLRRVRIDTPDTPVIMITGHATLDSAVEAMKAGAYHYLAKPFRLAEAREVVRAALEVGRLKGENRTLKQQVAAVQTRHTIVTQNLVMQKLLETARQIADAECSVVIHGESGTGKELLARYLHQHSRRSEGAFVAFNCGALSEDLAASELFGHEKGAFTGAQSRKIGLFEAAQGGTLFLDEVAELPHSIQIKLLRVLQEREVLRVGAVEPVALDVRVVAASNRDLKEAVEAGHLRNDLYFRLNVVTLTLPPLRERRDDVPLLAYFFLHKFAALVGKNVHEIDPEAMKNLAEYDFPGNVRELANFIERGVALAQGDILLSDHLPQHLGALTVRVFTPALAATPATLREQEQEQIRHALSLADGNKSEAARMLGIDRVSLWRKLKKFGIDG
jgi:DNA-binding NtrC family response regulator